MKVDSGVCETEEEFVDRRMLALVFDSGRDGYDQTFIFKIRRLENFQSDLFFNKQPIPCNDPFKFQYFMEDSVLKRQAFALIYSEKMMVVPINLSENQEVHSKEFYHYPGYECKCCTTQKRKIADELRKFYLMNFKILQSYNEGYGEEYKISAI